MAPSKRQMHLGVFWLGTGNHTAGLRYEGAATSNNSWPLVVAGAQTAEYGKLDLFRQTSEPKRDDGDVRYSAHFGLNSDIRRLPRRAKLRLMHRSKQALIKSLRGKRAAGEKRVDSFLRNAPVGEGGT
jgi:hypothetical protein